MAPLAPPRLFMWVNRVFFFFSLTTTALPASAAVLILVNKSTQQMSISVDGVPRYRFAVSTGRAGYGTPSGTYHPQRLAAAWHALRAPRRLVSAESAAPRTSRDLPNLCPPLLPVTVHADVLMSHELVWTHCSACTIMSHDQQGRDHGCRGLAPRPWPWSIRSHVPRERN